LLNPEAGFQLMAKMTAAEAAVRVLESEGVDLVSGQPGAAILPLYQSMKDRGTIQHVLPISCEAILSSGSGTDGRIGTPAALWAFIPRRGSLCTSISIRHRSAEFFVPILASCQIAKPRSLILWKRLGIRKARSLVKEHSIPVVVEVITERVTNIAMGPEIDQIKEFEPIEDRPLPSELASKDAPVGALTGH
jgi:glyoxylate carboligase